MSKFAKFSLLVASHATMARFSADNVTSRYFQVLWTTSRYDVYQFKRIFAFRNPRQLMHICIYSWYRLPWLVACSVQYKSRDEVCCL